MYSQAKLKEKPLTEGTYTLKHSVCERGRNAKLCTVGVSISLSIE